MSTKLRCNWWFVSSAVMLLAVKTVKSDWCNFHPSFVSQKSVNLLLVKLCIVCLFSVDVINKLFVRDRQL